MKCPQCGYISFDHLENCRKCGFALAKNQDQKLPLKSGEKAAYSKPCFQTSLPKESSDLKPFDQSHKETLMPKKVGTKRIGNLTQFSDENKYENKLDVHAIPQESIKENENSHNESVFFQESMSCEEEAGQDDFGDHRAQRRAQGKPDPRERLEDERIRHGRDQLTLIEQRRHTVVIARYPLLDDGIIFFA